MPPGVAHGSQGSDKDSNKDGSDEDASLLGTDATSIPPRLFWRLVWRILPALWLGYVLNIVDRTNLGYATLQMADDLHLSSSAFGTASGIFFLSPFPFPTTAVVRRDY